MRLCFFSVLAVAAALVVTNLPAQADGPVSITLGPQFMTQGNARTVGGATQIAYGLGLDAGPAIVVPIRGSLTFDGASGSANGGSLNRYGIGLAARTTTPLYIGAGLSFDSVHVHFAPGVSASTTGIGKKFFIGSKLFSAPGGVSFALEGSYRVVPSVAGVTPSAYGIGLRVAI